MAKLKDMRFILLGFLGFAGLLGFRYFFSGNPADLFYFGNFAFFASWILGGARYEFQDDRWKDNYYKASTIAFWIAMACILLIGIMTAWSFLSQELVIVCCVLGWDVSILAYATAFRIYERR